MAGIDVSVSGTLTLTDNILHEALYRQPYIIRVMTKTCNLLHSKDVGLIAGLRK